MTYNGSGLFQRLHSWTNDAANGVKISSSEMDAEDNGFAAGLSACLTKDGQQVPTANLPMGGFAHTGVGNATLRAQYAAAGQVQDGGLVWGGTAGGTANALTVNLVPPVTAYAAGQKFRFLSSAANTGAATLAVNALAATAITKQGATALSAGDIPNAAVVEVVYDGTRFELTNALPLNSPAFSGVPTAPTAANGTNTTQLATTAFVQNAYASSGGSNSASYTYAAADSGTLFLRYNAGAMTDSLPSDGSLLPSGWRVMIQNSAASAGITLTTSGSTYITEGVALSGASVQSTTIPAGQVTELVCLGNTLGYNCYRVLRRWGNAVALLSPSLLGTPTATTPGAGDSSTRVATTAFVNAAGSLATTGYQALPSGLIIQWGRLGSGMGGNATAAITFPVAFPSACFVAIPVRQTAGPTNDDVYLYDVPTTTGFVAQAGGSGANDVYWVALGA